MATDKAQGLPERVLLEDVPYIGFDAQRTGGLEGFPFPAAMRATMQFLGEDPGYDYDFHAGTSGAAFGLVWHTTRWFYSGDLSDLAVSTGWSEPIRRAFDAVGYTCEVIPMADGPENEALFRQRVIECIHGQGRPLLASGVVGPPCCTLVTGYDEGGDILVGWSYFQAMPGHGPAAEFEPTGQFRKRAWHPDTWAPIAIGDKREPPPLAQAYRQALQWAVEVVRTPRVLDRHAGLPAYIAWSEDLLRDEDFPEEDPGVLMERLDCHFGAASVTAEGRMLAARFVRRVAEHEPAMAGPLERAAACYDAISELMMRVFELQGGFDPHDERIARTLAKPGVRRQMVPLIREARDRDAEAVECIEQALARA